MNKLERMNELLDILGTYHYLWRPVVLTIAATVFFVILVVSSIPASTLPKWTKYIA